MYCAFTAWELLICPLLSDCAKWVFLNQHLKNFTLCSMSSATTIIILTCSAAKASDLGAGNKWMWTGTVTAIFAATLYGTLTWQCGHWGGKQVTDRHPALTSLSLEGLGSFGEDSNEGRAISAAGLNSLPQLKYQEIVVSFGLPQPTVRTLT